MIAIASPIIESEEIAAVQAVLESGTLAQGPKVAELEAAFAAYCGTKHAVAVNSGTAAIHAALYAAGVGPGDEVITTPFSFIATINPILFLGATPVLVDIDAETFNIDMSLVEQAITPKTKAILPVHLYGQPYDHKALQQLAAKHDLIIIEDACQAIGAEYASQKVGNLGDLACFSLYATKNIMCGEGGVVTTNSAAYAVAIRQFRQHGMSAQYEYVDVGYNYRLSDLHAAIAVEQLKKVDDFTMARQKNAALLSASLQDIPGLSLPEVKADRTHVYHQYTLRVTDDFVLDRAALLAALKERGIIAGIYYPKCLHAFKHVAQLGYRMGDFPVAERAAAEVLSLPAHPRVSEQDVQSIITAIKDIAYAK